MPALGPNLARPVGRVRLFGQARTRPLRHHRKPRSQLRCLAARLTACLTAPFPDYPVCCPLHRTPEPLTEASNTHEDHRLVDVTGPAWYPRPPDQHPAPTTRLKAQHHNDDGQQPRQTAQPTGNRKPSARPLMQDQDNTASTASQDHSANLRTNSTTYPRNTNDTNDHHGQTPLRRTNQHPRQPSHIINQGTTTTIAPTKDQTRPGTRHRPQCCAGTGRTYVLSRARSARVATMRLAAIQPRSKANPNRSRRGPTWSSSRRRSSAITILQSENHRHAEALYLVRWVSLRGRTVTVQ
jgi:hypothetical protein